MNVKLNDGSVRCAECLDGSQIDHSTFDACSYCGAVPELTTPAVVEYTPTLVEVIDEDGDVVESYDMHASRARSAARSERIKVRLAAERASKAMCPQRPTQAQAWEAFAAMARWTHEQAWNLSVSTIDFWLDEESVRSLTQDEVDGLWVKGWELYDTIRPGVQGDLCLLLKRIQSRAY